MTNKELLQIASKLSNEDICTLIHMLSHRIDIFIGSAGGAMITGGLSKDTPANLNGNVVQINTEYTDDDNDLTDSFKKYFIEEVLAMEVDSNG